MNIFFINCNKYEISLKRSVVGMVIRGGFKMAHKTGSHKTPCSLMPGKCWKNEHGAYVDYSNTAPAPCKDFYHVFVTDEEVSIVICEVFWWWCCFFCRSNRPMSNSSHVQLVPFPTRPISKSSYFQIGWIVVSSTNAGFLVTLLYVVA
jgi:hypothetical protein